MPLKIKAECTYQFELATLGDNASVYIKYRALALWGSLRENRVIILERPCQFPPGQSRKGCVSIQILRHNSEVIKLAKYVSPPGLANTPKKSCVIASIYWKYMITMTES